MITKFGYLYAGHVDLDDLGLAGTPVNDRWLSDENLASAFEKAADIARVMDRSGFDTMWLAEHHFQREGYECIPNILMLAVHLAHLAERIDFGCGFNVTPMWHPLRLAEDFRHRGHTDRRARRLRSRARLPHPRGGGVRRAAPGHGRQPGAVRGAGRRDHGGAEGAVVLAPRQELRHSPESALPGLRAGGHHSRPQAAQTSVGVLAAHRQRESQGSRLHGQARDEGCHRGRRRAGRSERPGHSRVAGRPGAERTRRGAG